MSPRRLADAVITALSPLYWVGAMLVLMVGLMLYPIYALAKGLFDHWTQSRIEAEMTLYRDLVRQMGPDAAREFQRSRNYPYLH